MKAFFSGFWEGFKEFGHNINTLVNSILLSVVYVFGVGFTSIAARLVGKRFLVTETTEEDTYWEDLDPEKKPIEEHYRQF